MLQILVLIEIILASFTSLAIDATVKNYSFRKDTQRGVFGCLILVISFTVWHFN